MDISTITHVTSDYIKNALEESAKASNRESGFRKRVPVSTGHGG